MEVVVSPAVPTAGRVKRPLGAAMEAHPLSLLTGCIMETLWDNSLVQNATEVIESAVEYTWTPLKMDR